MEIFDADNKPKGINMNLSLDMLNPDTLDRLCHLQTNVKQLENTASDHHKKLKVLIKQMKACEDNIEQYNARTIEDFYSYTRQAHKQLEGDMIAFYKDYLYLNSYFKELKGSTDKSADSLVSKAPVTSENIIPFNRVQSTTLKTKVADQVLKSFDVVRDQINVLKADHEALVIKINTIVGTIRNRFVK